jgi:hypothetical protein
MTSRQHRSCQLRTDELHRLNDACTLITRAFGEHPYLVGSAGFGEAGAGYRDVDVRLMLGDEEFAAACPTRERWELLCLAIGDYLRARTALPIDFQVQQQSAANAAHDKPRNPLGTARVFAGGGDGTPEWPA